jgi:Cd2+/Zn2+-exporting ATPase
MAVAMGGALLLGDVIEAASIGAIVSFMDVVKLFAVERFARQLRCAVGGTPDRIDVPDGGTVLVSELRPNSVYILRAGDAVPADGVVRSGSASIDESRLTGEAMPEMKETGSKVFSGSVVAAGYLEVTAEKAASESFSARIADAVKDAQGSLSESEEIVGRFAKYYTPLVLVIASLVGFFQGFQRFLVVLVAGCPCALLGAAPFAHAASLAALASRHRLLLKRSSALEALARLRYVGLDKTGTITKGQFGLLELVPMSSTFAPSLLHRWIAAVEVRDNHPIARSLVQSYTGCLVNFAGSDELPAVDDFKRHGRNGVTATVDGHVVGVGNTNFLEAMGLPWLDVPEPVKAVHATWAKGGRTVLFALVDAQIAAVLVLEDSLKPEASATVAALRKLGVRPFMLTGDKPETAMRVAAASGIEASDVFHSLTPEDKARLMLEFSHTTPLATEQAADGRFAFPASAREDAGRGFAAFDAPQLAVDELMEKARTEGKASRGPHSVGFVGDGLNDCAALATADVGVVLQEIGSQATVDASSAVLRGDIGELPAAIVIARRTAKLIWVNVTLALLMNLAVIVAAATVGVPLWLGVAMDNLGLLVVLANSTWPLYWKVSKAKPHCCSSHKCAHTKDSASASDRVQTLRIPLLHRLTSALRPLKQ